MLSFSLPDKIIQPILRIYLSISISDGVEYSTFEFKYEYRKTFRVRILFLKNVLEYEYRKKFRVPSTGTFKN